MPEQAAVSRVSVTKKSAYLVSSLHAASSTSDRHIHELILILARFGYYISTPKKTNKTNPHYDFLRRFFIFM